MKQNRETLLSVILKAKETSWNVFEMFVHSSIISCSHKGVKKTENIAFKKLESERFEFVFLKKLLIH